MRIHCLNVSVNTWKLFGGVTLLWIMNLICDNDCGFVCFYSDGEVEDGTAGDDESDERLEKRKAKVRTEQCLFLSPLLCSPD